MLDSHAPVNSLGLHLRLSLKLVAYSTEPFLKTVRQKLGCLQKTIAKEQGHLTKAKGSRQPQRILEQTKSPHANQARTSLFEEGQVHNNPQVFRRVRSGSLPGLHRIRVSQSSQYNPIVVDDVVDH